jgi:hypothetical protein
MTGDGRPPAPGDEPEFVVEMFEQLRRGECSTARSSEFDGEWNAVKSQAELRYRSRIVGREHE